MDDLIKALQILRKYGNPTHPTNCSHDLLFVDIDPSKVSDEDKKELDELGFFDGAGNDCEGGFCSFKCGSC